MTLSTSVLWCASFHCFSQSCLLIPQGYLTPLSIFILLLWCPYWFCSSFSLMACLLFYWPPSPRHKRSLLSPIPKPNRQLLLTPDPRSFSSFLCSLSYSDLTVHMVLPFPRLSFPLQLYPARLWQHHQTKAAPLMMRSHLHAHPSSSLDFRAVKQTHLCVQTQYQRPSSLLGTSILSILYLFRTQSWAVLAYPLPGQCCVHLWNPIYFFTLLPPLFPSTRSIYSSSRVFPKSLFSAFLTF